MDAVGHGRRRRLRWFIAFGGVGVTAFVLVHFIPRFISNGALRADNGSYGFCFGPPTPAEWTAMAQSGQRFGLDVLSLSSGSARIEVTKVEMIDPSPGFELLEVAFIPIGGAGLAPPGASKWAIGNERLLNLAQTLPAHLRVEPLAAQWQQLPADAGKDWQLAVRVRVAPYSVSSRVAGFRITYRSGWLTRSVTTKDTIRIGTTNSDC